MPVDESLLQIAEYTGEGYLPLIDYASWRVAILRYIDELLPQNIGKMERHNETDEVFVLLAGRCILFIGEGAEQVSEVYGQDMEPLKLYNIRRRCWHTHTLSEDATVLVIENRDTGPANSADFILDAQQRAKLTELTDLLWGKD